MSNTFLATLFEHKAWCNRGLIDALRAVPEDADRVQMAIITLTFEHTSIVDRIFRAHLTGAKHDFDSAVSRRVPNLDELAYTMSETDAWYVDYAARVTPEELDEIVEFTFVDGDPGRMSKGDILAHVVTHGASHRGAVGKMLETLKVQGASDMVTSFMHAR